MGLITKGMGAVLTKFKGKPKRFNPKQEKINKIRLKALGVGAAGAGIVAAGVKNIKNTIEKEYGKKKE
jgi:hypothetical protein|tara:strand:+ start:407 stop:610 length:204 start_codon:yes stop_codon:yes gene_type:complete